MSETRTFSLGAILNITDGHLVTTTDDVYDICCYLLSDPGITTIGLLAVSKPCREALLAQHPQLAAIPYIDGKLTDPRAWLSEQEAKYGKELPVSPIAHPPERRSVVDDILDIQRRNPKAEIMVIEP